MMAERGARVSGSQLIEQGAEQFVRGVAGTLGNEIKVGGRMAVLGGAIGLIAGALDTRTSVLSAAWHTAKLSGALGAFLGWETAAIPGNENAKEQGLPTATFVDWLIANLIFFHLDDSKIEYWWGSVANSSVRVLPSIARSLLINAETVSGVKNILRGLWRKVWE